MTRFPTRAALLLAVALLAGVAACSGGGSAGGDSASATVTVQGDVPVAYVRRSTSVRMNPTNGAPFAPEQGRSHFGPTQSRESVQQAVHLSCGVEIEGDDDLSHPRTSAPAAPGGGDRQGPRSRWPPGPHPR